MEYVPLIVALLFLIANATILRVILTLNRRKQAIRVAPPIPRGDPLVDPTAILAWEFEYARITASESMAERHTMVNFYLLIAGITTSGVLALLARQSDLPTVTGAALFWVLVGIGWIYFLAIIRLRQAWRDSAKAMNRIKGFCIEHACSIDPETLRTAFLWQPQTLPPADKPWTVFFYPGGTSERIHLFWGEVDRRQQAARGAASWRKARNSRLWLFPLARPWRW